MYGQIISEILNWGSRFISDNFLTIFNTFLIGITILLSYQSFKFQTRTGIRESLEQLEDVEFYNEKFSPILHKLIFRPIRGIVQPFNSSTTDMGENQRAQVTFKKICSGRPFINLIVVTKVVFLLKGSDEQLPINCLNLT